MGVCTGFYQGVAFVCSGKAEKDWLDSGMCVFRILVACVASGSRLSNILYHLVHSYV